MGARPMRRAIQSLIEDPVSEKIISSEVKPGHKVKITAENGSMVFNIAELESVELKV